MIAGKRRLGGKCLARVERIPGEDINPVRQAHKHAEMTRGMAGGAQRDHGAVAEEITVRYQLDYGASRDAGHVDGPGVPVGAGTRVGQLAITEDHLRGREHVRAASMVEMQVGQNDVGHVGQPVAGGEHLPVDLLIRREVQLQTLGPLAVRAARVNYCLRSQAGVEQYEAVPVLDEKGRRRDADLTPIGRTEDEARTPHDERRRVQGPQA